MARIDKFRKLFHALCPQAPYADAQQILEAANAQDKKSLPRSITLWLVLVAHIRHQHTEYEKLLEEGYERDAARHFTREAINTVLRKWGCNRVLENEE